MNIFQSLSSFAVVINTCEFFHSRPFSKKLCGDIIYSHENQYNKMNFSMGGLDLLLIYYKVVFKSLQMIRAN